MSISHVQLRAFHAVALEGGFTKAAKALNVSQPTLSAQVKALEEAFGVKLFDRRGRGSQITQLGEALLQISSRYFGLETEAEQLLAASGSMTRGLLRVAADAPYHVTPLLAVYNRRYPGVSIKLAFGNSEQVIEMLFDKQADIAVLPDPRSDRRLIAQPVKRDRLLVFVERGHPWARRRSIRLREIANERLVLRERGSVTRAIFERALERAAIKPQSSIEIGSREGVREAVASGLGVGVVFESEFGRDPRIHALTVRDANLQSTEYAVCLKEHAKDRTVSAFFELLPAAAD